jgi:hypothetical protein
MKEEDGEYLLEEQVILLVRIYLNNLIILISFK